MTILPRREQLAIHMRLRFSDLTPGISTTRNCKYTSLLCIFLCFRSVFRAANYSQV